MNIFNVSIKRKFFKGLLLGILLGVVTVVCLALLLSFCFRLYDWQIVSIINYEESIVNQTVNCLSREELIALSGLREKGIILTPAEYMNHMATYYNVLVTVVSIVFLGATLIKWSLSKSEAEEIMNRCVKSRIKEISNEVSNQLSDTYSSAEEVSQLARRIELLENDRKMEVE